MRAGVIGLGRMGSRYAQNLLQAGYDTAVYDVDAEKCAALVAAGAYVAQHPAEVAEQADVIVLSLLTVEIVEDVLFGPRGVVNADLQGKLILDTSTLIPSVSQAFARTIRERGGAMLDAPVTGGEQGAANGTLNIMVGGEEPDYRRALPVLDVLGGKIVHIGANGHGLVAKAVNQMIMVGYFGVIAESFGFADQLGVDIDKVFAAIEDGGPQSAILSGFGQTYCKGQPPAAGGPKDPHYVPTFKKDITYAMREAQQHDSYIPVTSTVNELLKQVLHTGVGDTGPLRLFEFWRDLLNAQSPRSRDH